MGETKIVFHFNDGNPVVVQTETSFKEHMEYIKSSKGRFYEIDGKLINLDNVTCIRESQKARITKKPDFM